MKEVPCFVFGNDKDSLILRNKDRQVPLKFIYEFEELSKMDADFYIPSLQKASTMYDQFVQFMRTHPTSRFLFLEEWGVMIDQDFTIRDEPNTDEYMYNPGAALEMISNKKA